MKREIISTRNAPSSTAPVSQGTRAGQFVFTAGQIAIDPQTGKLVEGGIEEQTRRTLDNIKAILEAGGSSLDKVVKATVFLADMNDFAAMNKVYGTYFKNGFPPRSGVQVAKLALDAKVEIEAIGVI